MLLPSYLSALGLGATQIGVIVFGTLFGSALVTLWAGLAGQRIGRRRLLLGACGLMMATGLGFIYVKSFWPLFAVALVGTLNPSSGDVSVFLPLEQAALAQTAEPRRRTDGKMRIPLVKDDPARRTARSRNCWRQNSSRMRLPPAGLRARILCAPEQRADDAEAFQCVLETLEAHPGDEHA